MTKPDGVKRYDMFVVEGAMGSVVDPVEDKDGSWVSWRSYDRLAEEVGRLRALLREADGHVVHADICDQVLTDCASPCSCGSDHLRERIDQALTKGDCDE